MTLYALLLDAIRKTAFQAYSVLNNQLQLGASNGFTVLQEIICRHHPPIANTLAPSYATILANQHKMLPPGQEGTYELLHATYLATFCDWETQLSYYQDFRLTQLLFGYIHGLVHKLLPHVLGFENLLNCHHTAHCFRLTEPSLPSQCDADELHLILKAAVQGLDMATSLTLRLPSTPGIAAIEVAALDFGDAQTLEDNFLDHFAEYCKQDLSTDAPLYDSCVSAIQHSQQQCFPRG
jgi:hypothetical protein